MPSGFLGRGIGPSAFGGGGLVAPVPVAGAELLTNGGMETGDPPTGWSVSDATAASVAEERTGGAGSKSVRGTMIAGSGWVFRSVTAADGTWLQANGWGKSETGNCFVRLANNSYATLATSTASTAIWGLRTCTARLNTANGKFIFVGGNTGTTFLGDDASCVPLILASLLSTRVYASANCDLSAAVTRTAGTQAGFVARLDSATSPANFIISYLDGAGNVKVDKAVAGVYMNVISGAVTYVAGGVLRLVCSGNDVSAYYNGTQVGTTQTVSDAGITGNLRHGLFSTYASNSFTGYVAA